MKKREAGSSQFDDDLDYEAEGKAASPLLAKEDESDVPMCGCLSVRYYQPYFDIDTGDITKRVTASVLYLKRDDSFMGIIRDKPDAYGPFWVSTTLVFVVAFTSHLSSWLASWMVGKNWAYDFESVVTAATLIYGFAFGAPALLWLLLRQFEPKVKLITILCLYGYSLCIFVPWAFFCLVPSAILSWVSLLGACVLSGLFLARNLAPTVLEIAGHHAATILGVVAFGQFCFSLTLKLSFFYY
jgi:hypothetical protein